MFDEPGTSNFAEREHKTLSFWNRAKIFEKSDQKSADAPHYTFFDGPPFATGLPHYGHLLAGTIKDTVCRYQSMKGHVVPRRFGWDCHGLPIENIVEKKEGLSGAASIKEFGIERFNETCRENVLTYTQQWKQTVQRVGRWIDLDNAYKTMDTSYMESVWWVFKELYKKGLIYKGHKVMPFSWKLGTPLSNFEASENYQEVDDPSVVIAFKLKNEEVSLLAWTTTPWTLLSNMALAVHPEVEYVKLKEKESGKSYILAKARVGEYFKDQETYTVEEEFLGTSLQDKSYEPLFETFKDKGSEGAFRVILQDFVTVDDGTGIVHMAPAFGENDFYACETNGVPLVCPINENGKFTSEIPEYEGRLFYECNKEIARSIKEKGQLFYQGTIRHRYPFCWRSDTPLMYRMTDTWFVAVESLKDKLIENNKKIHWVPEHIQEGRFGKWLEGVRDWAISRNRFWGTPIPLWESEDGDLIAIGSIKELEEISGEKHDDIHRHHIDDIEIQKNGKSYKRVDGVFDCWFESGSMPYAQGHYPFNSDYEMDKFLPADFIAEGLDQTRGWFYTLHVLSTALFDRPAFKNVVVNGIILASDGNKMSKRLNNYPEPTGLIEKYGADALRLYLMQGPAVRADDIRFQESGVELVLRKILLPWWNSYTFLVTYARLYKWEPTLKDANKEYTNDLDRWVLSRVQTLVEKMGNAMDSYHLWEAITPMIDFIDELTNWYIRRSRRRFWQEEDLEDRNAAMYTLFHVLTILSKAAAPFVPFLSEDIYQNLRFEGSPESVHLCDYPVRETQLQDQKVEESMSAVQSIVSMGHALRKEHKLKVRQPLSLAHVVCNHTQAEAIKEYFYLIKDELNVKEVKLHVEDPGLLKPVYKANFKQLGKRLGKLMSPVQKLISNLSSDQVASYQSEGSLVLKVADEEVTLAKGDIEVSYQVADGVVAAHEKGLTIALEVELTEELIIEGLARECVNKVNTLRKEKGFDLSDRIKLTVSSQDETKLKQVFEAHGEYILSEVLGTGVEWAANEGEAVDINGIECMFSIIHDSAYQKQGV